MTVTGGVAGREGAETPEPTVVGRLAWVPYAAFALAILGIWVLGRADAGLNDAWLLVAIATTLPLYVASRGWRLPWWMHATAVALPLSVMVVAAIHGYPEGAAKATRYGYGVLLILAIAAWAKTPSRRIAVAVSGAVLAADQYIAGWYWWWGEGDPGQMMSGMFHWHNQFAIYCAIGAAFAAVLAMVEGRAVMLVGFLVVALTTAGVMASGSRAVLVLEIGALLVALVIGLVVHRWRGLGRWLVLVALSIGTIAFMMSPVFFPDSAGGALPATDRTQTLQASGADRWDFWRVGIVMGADNWIAGVGLNNYGPKNLEYALGAYSSHPHNELIVAWAEGGLIAFLPLLTIFVGAVWLVLRSILAPLPGVMRGQVKWLPTRTELALDAGRWAGLLALVIAALHMLIDFDWAWPSVIALGTLAGGLAAAPLAAPGMEMARHPRWLVISHVGAVAVIVVLAVVGFAIDPLRAIPAMPVGGWPVIDR